MPSRASDRPGTLSGMRPAMLRAIAMAGIIGTGVVTTVIASDDLRQLGAIAGMWTALWIWFWSQYRDHELMLLIPCSFIIVVPVCAGFARSVPLMERALGRQGMRHLELSARVMTRVTAEVRDRDDTWEAYGPDRLFYRRQPGSAHRSAYDHASTPTFDTRVDQLGYLNGETSEQAESRAGEVFITGGSVLQGVGRPGVIPSIRPQLASRLISLAAGGYGPRQKTEALRRVGLPRRPSWLVLEFFSGNDASEALTDDLCERAGRDYTCTFDLPFLEWALYADAEYRGFARKGAAGDAVMRRLRRVKSDWLPLAVGARLARDVKSAVRAGSQERRQAALPDQAVAGPDYAPGVPVEPAQRLAWITRGLEMTTRLYDGLLAETQGTTRLLLLYDPSAYEVYRDILPAEMVSPESDAIAALQRSTVRAYAQTRGVPLCDMTDAFRDRVRRGERQLFGRYDGVHWSAEGQRIAGDILLGCLESQGIR